jgi:integrase/recombinase XerD
MSGKQAKIPSQTQIKAALAYLEKTRHPERNKVMFLLSYHCGLRSCEVAGVNWYSVFDANGDIGEHLSLENRMAKMRSGRTIPLSDDLKTALRALHKANLPPSDNSPIVYSERGRGMSAASVTQFFFHLYRQLGFTGCASHSGRRYFITASSRKIGLVGGSLRDVQYMAGHSSLTTTSRYIDTDSEAAKKLVNLL